MPRVTVAELAAQPDDAGARLLKRKWWTVRVAGLRGEQVYRCPTEDSALRLLEIFNSGERKPG